MNKPPALLEDHTASSAANKRYVGGVCVVFHRLMVPAEQSVLGMVIYATIRAAHNQVAV